MKCANISEIFYSLQGEGPLLGKPFLFVRFGGCNLSCTYCDTKWSVKPNKICTVSAGNSKKRYNNPITIKQFQKILSSFNFNYLTFTGGEPLLFSDFIEESLIFLKNKKILVETNGTLPNSLSKKLIQNTDYWSIDIKIYSTSGLRIHKEHKKFLKNISNGKNIILKCVFSPLSSKKELEEAYETALQVHKNNPGTVLIYQPLTQKGKITIGNNTDFINSLAEKGKMDVRIIPQVHKILKIK